MRFSIFQESATGSRPVNQDRMGYCFTRDSLLMVLADGMGGHPRGEVAAQLAVQAAGAAFQQRAHPLLADPVEFLRHAFMAGHRDILRYQVLHALREAPRTTIVACLIQQGRAWWAHAGDSRCYWIRDSVVRARTRDHSRVEQLLELGLLQPAQAGTHPERHLVSNCLGGSSEPRIDIGGGVALAAGDTVLLCSDGVWSAIAEDELCRRLQRAPVSASIPEMVRDAVAAAGPRADNATAVAVTWEGDLPQPQGLAGVPLADQAVTTTIALGGADADAGPDLTEEEIERAIREIREAIQRHGGR